MKTNNRNTCLNCAERTIEPNCHGYCEKYLKAIEEYNKQKEQINENKRFDVEYMACKVKIIRETKKKSHK